jgi:HK97 family phage portal protein
MGVKFSLASVREAVGRAVMRWLPDAGELIAQRTGWRSSPSAVTGQSARRHSAVWACLRLRGDLVSTLPVDAFRNIGGLQIEISKPPMLVKPGGERVNILEWLYSSQNDLDVYGNSFGLITAKNALGLPARIDLQPASSVTVQIRDGELAGYKIGTKQYTPDQVWHEKQYTLSGCHVGLSPIAYAAWQITAGLSAQEFAADWFANGATPTARLKNTAKTLNASEAELVKTRFKAAVSNHDIFVSGSDWDYEMISVPANEARFIEMMEFSIVDIARYMGCPADLIDAAVSGQSVTYANISERNLQFLIMNLGPVLKRRETAMSDWLPRPQFVKFNQDALLRMDPETRAKVIGQKVKDRTMTNDEARALDNKPPLTDEQIERMNLIYGAPNKTPTATSTRGLHDFPAFEQVSPLSAVPLYDHHNIGVH